MMEIILMEVTDNFELELLGQPRKAYKKGERILVHSSERLRFLRLGMVELDSKLVKPSDIFADAKKPESKK